MSTTCASTTACAAARRRARVADADGEGPAAPFDAAQAVFKSRDAGALPASTRRSPRKPIPRVKQAMTEARAAIMLYPATTHREEKIAAIAVIRDRGDQDALALIGACRPIRRTTSRRRQPAPSPRSKAIWRSGTRFRTPGTALSLGSVLLLAAIGLAITFGVMGVINMAHGEMVMLGAYTTFVVQDSSAPITRRCSTIRSPSPCRSPSSSPARSVS